MWTQTPRLDVSPAADGVPALREATDGELRGLDRLTRLAVLKTGAEMAAVVIVEGDWLYHASSCGLPARRSVAAWTHTAATYCSLTVASGRALAIEDARIDPRVRDGPGYVHPVVAYLGEPLVRSDGRIVGTLCVGERHNRVWHEDDREAIALIAESAAAEIEALVPRGVDHLRIDQLERAVADRTADLRRAKEDLRLAHADMRLVWGEMIRRLGHAESQRFVNIGGGIDRMSVACEGIARILNMGDERCAAIRVASLLHDIGMIGVPDAVVLKRGPLTALERRAMNTHAHIGHELLRGTSEPTVQLAAVIAQTHHEWFDGSGYPDGRAGKDIPIAGRIAAVADVFDALTSDRPHRKALALPEALEVMKPGRGTQFDPVVFDAFRAGLARIAVESGVILTESS